jgi:hypothetical protein
MVGLPSPTRTSRRTRKSGIPTDGVIVSRSVLFCLACGLALFGLSGCDESLALPESAGDIVSDMGCAFDPNTAATIHGQVTWQGAIPQIPSYRSPLSPGNEHRGEPLHIWPNPHVPVINPASKGVAGAVLFLRGVDPCRARPWDHPPVRVELRDTQIHVCQGDRDGKIGFVRRGDTIEMVSRQAIFHSLRVRGAAFFARAFPDADRPSTRRLDKEGLVELSSGCGYFWMRGHLFVADHPYYTLSDADGRFVLPQVPPGRYELVCWLPNWQESSRELDAETAFICRLTFRPPVETKQAIQVDPAKIQTVGVELNARRFDSKR